MSTREALLAAIIAHPEDDTPRLVYADYLDETGDPNDAARAELIRTQIDTASLPAGDPRRRELESVARQLWERHREAWFAGIKPSKLPYPERGFVTNWGWYSPTEIASDAPIFAREPISSLTMSVSATALGAMEMRPEFARIGELKLWPGETDDAGLVPFFSSPQMSGLHSLWIMGKWVRPWSPMPESTRLLASRPQYSSLERLKIEHATVGDDGARRLAASTTLNRLRYLGLGQCEIGIDGLRAILASPVLSTVSYLDLGGIARTADEGEALADALVGSKYLGHLEALVLDESAFTDRAAARLAQAVWPALRRLTVLPLDRGHSDVPTGLPTLTAQGVENLMSASWAEHLELLDLSGQPIGDAGAVVLARDNRLVSLTRLSLMHTGITAVGLRDLLMAHSRHLSSIQMAGCPLGDAGAAVIAVADWSAMGRGGDWTERGWGVDPYNPDGLLFGGCGIGDLGAEALVRSTTIPRDVPDVFLGRSPVSQPLVARLKTRYPKANVRY
jgi:uncharacterized protein (TIGR02996 family)